MKKNRIASTIVLVLIMCFETGFQKNNGITAEKIINKYYKAVGGYDKIKGITTLIRNGHYIEPAYNIIVPAKTEHRRPNFRVIGDVDVVGFEEGYNGKAWEYHKGKGLIWSEGEAEKAIIRGAEFDFSFVDSKEKGYQVSYKGITDMGGLKTYNLEVVLTDGWLINYYIDINSNLVIGQRKAMPIHAKGNSVEIIQYYSDYRSVNGVLFPFTIIERNTETGKMLNATIFDTIEANVNIPMEHFDPPIE